MSEFSVGKHNVTHKLYFLKFSDIYTLLFYLACLKNNISNTIVLKYCLFLFSINISVYLSTLLSDEGNALKIFIKIMDSKLIHICLLNTVACLKFLLAFT